MKPSASFWLYAPRSSSNVAIRASNSESGVAVRDEVEPADAVLRAQLVELRQYGVRRQLLAVHRHRVAGLVLERHELGLVGRVFRIFGPAPDVVRRRPPRIFQPAALVRD